MKYAAALTDSTITGNVIQVSSSRPSTFLRNRYSIGPIRRVYRTMNRATHPKEMTGTPSNVSMCCRRLAANSSSVSVMPKELYWYGLFWRSAVARAARCEPASRTSQSQNWAFFGKSANGDWSRSKATTVTRPRP